MKEQTKLKVQIGMSIIISGLVGVVCGLYIASRLIGNFIPELAR